MSSMPEFEYKRPETLKELFDLLPGYESGAAILAGGTDLMPRIKRGLEKPGLVVDIKDIEGLSYVEDKGEKVKIGALTTIFDIRNNTLIKDKYPALHEAATLTASENIQLRGSIGGNILQNTRCLYYNKSEAWRDSFKPCLKNGGDICNAAKGGKRCFSVYRGDLAPALMSLGASVCIVSENGEKETALEDIFTGDGVTPFSLSRDELIKNVIIPSAKMKGGYGKFRMRKAVDYPSVNVAISMDTGGKGRLVVGSVGAKPFMYEFSSLEELKEIPERAYKDVSPINNMSLSPYYRKNMVRVLAEELIRRV
ncbi:MAG: FAD binding domain-containing protein [Proteobacteria bacterium]|nr:FAD binding domain-containing protein [Pseudomonadota bacterium]MBU1964676.1 FAD binding domain-containing protein [Pseudomonadota bacterium]MBU4372771.1 FAD binding domain-containing protein [Pseudomonadota bacterium]MBU4582941.1 FAD binding domain-containing protein [Pseudomonadota bacterium]MCG2742011.1 FAD binding domain-containing protein [Syntrophaceae bacterium]